MASLWTVPRRLTGVVGRFLRGKDINLHAAAVTFYGGIAVVPVALLTIKLAGVLAGRDWVMRVSARVVAAVPATLGADRATQVLIGAGLKMSTVLTLTALIPATLYGEGLRRAFVSLAAPEKSSAGWRGRLLILPVIACGPVLLLGLLTVLPGAAGMLREGGWASVWAVLVSFLAAWIALSPVLILVYRVVGPVRPGWLAAVPCGSFTAANLSGFAHGFVLFWALPLNLGVPFGGLRVVGAVVAIALWLYLFHTLTLIGYAVTLQVHRVIAQRPLNGHLRGGVPVQDAAEVETFSQ